MATQAEMVEAVKRHAEDYYEDGWDIVVECWDTADIINTIGKARTTDGAVRKVKECVTHIELYRKEIEATAF